MSFSVQDIRMELERFAPGYLAEPWDSIGLFTGDPNQKVERILVALGVSPEVIEEAIAKSVDLIVTHHPAWMKPIERLTTETLQGRMALSLVENKIAVLSAHTNLDSSAGGINDVLAQSLSLINVTPLVEFKEEWLKLVVFVPETHTSIVEKALGDLGCGTIGRYSHCSFMTKGVGKFRPLEGASPAIGVVNRSEEVEEVKLEIVISMSQFSKIMSVLKEVHPYEEVAYDLIPLKNKIKSTFGLGRIGQLQAGCTMKEFVTFVKETLKIPHLRICGDLNKNINTVALCGGSGMSLLDSVIAQKADVYLTADVKHHDAEYALAHQVNLIDGGHYGTEKIILPIIAEKLREFTKEIWVSQNEKEIFEFL